MRLINVLIVGSRYDIVMQQFGGEIVFRGKIFVNLMRYFAKISYTTFVFLVNREKEMKMTIF